MFKKFLESARIIELFSVIYKNKDGKLKAKVSNNRLSMLISKSTLEKEGCIIQEVKHLRKKSVIDINDEKFKQEELLMREELRNHNLKTVEDVEKYLMEVKHND